MKNKALLTVTLIHLGLTVLFLFSALSEGMAVFDDESKGVLLPLLDAISRILSFPLILIDEKLNILGSVFIGPTYWLLYLLNSFLWALALVNGFIWLRKHKNFR